MRVGVCSPEPGRSTLYLSTSVLKYNLKSTWNVLNATVLLFIVPKYGRQNDEVQVVSTFLGNLQYLYLYLSTFQMYLDFQVLLEYI